jgi:hypothetical protein
MKTRLFFILFAGICWTFAAQAQTGNLKGEWTLSSVTITENDNGIETDIPYVKGKYDNPSACVYPLLKFQERSSLCICVDDNLSEQLVQCNPKGQNQITFWFKLPVTLEFFLDAEEKLYLSHESEQYDDVLKRSVVLKINLIYSKLA